MVQTFREVIALWPSPEEMADEIGVPYRETYAWTIHKWRSRDFIPATWWSSIMAAPRAKDAGVTLDLMAALAAKTKRVTLQAHRKTVRTPVRSKRPTVSVQRRQA